MKHTLRLIKKEDNSYVAILNYEYEPKLVKSRSIYGNADQVIDGIMYGLQEFNIDKVKLKN